MYPVPPLGKIPGAVSKKALKEQRSRTCSGLQMNCSPLRLRWVTGRAAFLTRLRLPLALGDGLIKLHSRKSLQCLGLKSIWL
ncbi:hypothetical protein Y1Q_0013122 [Alligator mississippiensis]|uniref:Uncharacterized protein n=1 Tax=Alligator mississippiensis TaxID=8496 RepID=A0A151NH54_ALLMI|nr:hypothetical protein Y1Q_0013122 [Alligator mississippiensis]